MNMKATTTITNVVADTITAMNTKATTTHTVAAADTIMDTSTKVTIMAAAVAGMITATTTAMTMDTITVMTMAAAVVAAAKRWRKNITTTLRIRKWRNIRTIPLM